MRKILSGGVEKRFRFCYDIRVNNFTETSQNYCILYPCGVRYIASQVLSQHSYLGSLILRLSKTSLIFPVEVCGGREGTHLHMQVQNTGQDGIVGFNILK